MGKHVATDKNGKPTPDRKFDAGTVNYAVINTNDRTTFQGYFTTAEEADQKRDWENNAHHPDYRTFETIEYHILPRNH